MELGRLTEDQEALLSRIRVLSSEIWENTVSLPDIDRWLDNFTGQALPVESERLNALHLLSHFNYFGLKEVRELLHAIFRDLFRYPIVQEVRSANAGTRDATILENGFAAELNRTRFLGMGNPSESGAHLLYYFRQINSLSKRFFVHQHEILDSAPGSPHARLAIPDLKRLVFIDDLLGSGTQAKMYSEKLLRQIREASARDNVNLEILYFTMFAKPDGLAIARATEFDRVEAVHELDESESTFASLSRVYTETPVGVTRADGEKVAEHYGNQIFPSGPLGFMDGQMMLGLHHNIPDNTLPIFWGAETAVPWSPVFPRFQKVY